MSGHAPSATRIERYFSVLLGLSVALGAAIRLVYVFTDTRVFPGGDGFDYFLSGRRLADGYGYTSSLGDVGKPIAHHPPGWVTLLGIVNWLGAKTLHEDQLVGVVLGLGVVVLAGVIGRRFFNPRVGVIAAILAAVYPGFWLLEGGVLSEPLDLFVVGMFTLAVFGLHARPTMRRALIVGGLCGLLALVRSEQVGLLVIVVVPVIASAHGLSPRRRAALGLAACVVTGAVIAPWTIYNSTRFKDPVLLSTNDGNLLLLGNCPPFTYQGEKLGFYDLTCQQRNGRRHLGYDRSQLDSLNRHQALHYIKGNLGRMPVVVPARFGRLLAIFRPSQTVNWVADWMATGTSPIWGWVISYWFLIPFALLGAIGGRRERRFLLPLLGPVVIVAVSVAISYGEPRYHTPSDLGVIVLAAAGIERLFRRQANTAAPVVEHGEQVTATASGTRRGG
jgi:4-amino-4-deoxy-L-arabinose transferase-like glycosyltransferase